ncbi:hypothetical protein AOLI_G00038640 [Acnodon oligacanthus]
MKEVASVLRPCVLVSQWMSERDTGENVTALKDTGAACCDQLRHSTPSLFSSKGSFFSSAQRLESLVALVYSGSDFSWQSTAHAGVQWTLQEMGGTLEILACCTSSCIQVQKQTSFVAFSF